MNIDEIEEKTNQNFPNCDKSIDSICSLLGKLKSSEDISQMKFLFYDVEDLFCQIRYNLFEALKIFYSQENSKNEVQDLGLAIDSFLLSRPYIQNKSQFNFTSLEERRRGKNVAAWLFHILIDNAIFRIISIFDRVACIITLSGNIKFSNSKVYFRSKKLKTIFSYLPEPEIERMLEISQSEEYEYILNYRDSLNHTFKKYSKEANCIAGDIVFDSLNDKKVIKPENWNQKDLLTLSSYAFQLMEETLTLLEIYLKNKYDGSFHWRNGG